MPGCYNQDNWSNESVVGQLPAGKDVITEAEDTAGIRQQATTGEYTANGEDLLLKQPHSLRPV
jgi:hypothetical protein